MSDPQIGQVWARNTGWERGSVLVVGPEENLSYGSRVWKCYVMCDENVVGAGGGYYDSIPLLAFGFEELI